MRDHQGMDIESLAAAAAELAERMALLATLPALPGDTAVTWLEHRIECQDLVELLTAGLHFMVTPA